MRSVLILDETPPAIMWSKEATTKNKSKLPTSKITETVPLTELSFLAKYVHVKTRKGSQNTDLDMREILGIEKALKTIRVNWQRIP